ncbi:MAG TPA: hypothetical protein VLQ93_24345, partial [Myxococcaceae bacterium]|nr:hypothetical protein [Myxococcaceae bacterium]
NPIKSGRNIANQVRNGAREVTNRAKEAVSNTKEAVGNTVDKARSTIGHAVDAFETKATRGAQALGQVVGLGHQPDRAFDGHYVGARGQTFPPGTPLSQVPGVKPLNNPNPTRTLLYVNGINTTKDAQFSSLQNIADRTGAQVIGVHNATEGMGADLAQCVKDKLDKGRNPAVDTLADTIYTELKAGRTVDLMAHSQGGLVTSRALSDVQRRLRIEDGMSKADAQALMSKVNVETFGAAAAHYPDGPNYVHYINRADPVPTLFGLGIIPDKWNPLVDGGKGSVVHHFNELHRNPIDGHSFDGTYLNRRVPFEDARAGRFE